MDKAVLRNFAIESRKDLMEKIDRKIKLFYVDEEFKKDNRGDVIVLSNDKHTLTLTKDEDSNRDKLIRRIIELGYNQVVEEAAYTWFNRIIAIRYMEIHDYLPLTKDNQSIGINVFETKDGESYPEIIKFSNLNNSELDLNFNLEIYSNLKNDDEKFKYALLLICQKLGKVIPQVFDGVTDYIDLLIPDNMMRDNGIINILINEVKKENFDNVEVIGWLYQYYISDKKDEVFYDMKQNIKLNKNTIPAATQLFTPNWIVEYMTQNTIGNYINEKNNLNFYIKNDKVEINKVDIEDLKFIDPCCGSGHIIVEAFDLFYKMYQEKGYSDSLIPKLIIKNNIYGIDIDSRAAQLSILSVLLKARKYDKYLFKESFDLNILSIEESNNLDIENLKYELSNEAYTLLIELYDKFIDAKEFGSILNVKKVDYSILINELNTKNSLIVMMSRDFIEKLIKQNSLLTIKYDFVVTNPPYVGLKGMSDKLSDMAKKEYKDSRNDLFSMFIEKSRQLTKENGFYALITPPSIISLTSYEKLREKLINEQTIITLLHMGRGIFGIDFGSSSYVIQNKKSNGFIGDYFKLYQRTFQYIDLNDIKDLFLKSKNNYNFTFNFSKYSSNEEVIEANDKIDDLETSNTNEETKIHYLVNQEKFNLIPGHNISFWLSDNIVKLFDNKNISDFGEAKQGLATGCNDLFLREWFEVNFENISFNSKSSEDALLSKKKWFPYNKGGNYLKWYGNDEYVVNWENDGYEIKHFYDKKGKLRSRPQNLNYYFKKSITWSLTNSTGFGVRSKNDGYIFDINGMSLFLNNDKYYYYIMSFLNTKIADILMKSINPTMANQSGDILQLPIIIDESKIEEINNLSKDCISIAKSNWDYNETSWDFKKNRLIDSRLCLIKDKVNEIISIDRKNFEILKEKEERINDIYINIFGLQSELNKTISENNITFKIDDKVSLIKKLIHYSVGCMFGRYSLDFDGLTYAGGQFDKKNYTKFLPDNDNIIPIADNESIYYNDDIVGKFTDFIKVAFGEKYLNENLEYISEVLGKRGTESYSDTIRRYFVNDFYNDHLKMYQKRPIYWMFDSGKKNGFKCLVYLHRYDEQLVSKIRTKYLHNTLSVYQRTLEEIDYKINNEELSTIYKRNLQNEKVDIIGKITECNEYDEKVGNVANKMIKLDLDDGVAVNYSKFVDDNGKSILANIK